MLIYVETVVGKRIEISGLEPSSTCQEVKEKIEESENLPTAMQKLIHGGRPMNDTQTLQEVGIEAGAVIHMVLALRAGQ